MFEEEINGEGVGDEEPLVDSDGDEIAGDVSASDALAVEDVIREADGSFRLNPLPSNQANLGKVSIAKVSPKFINGICNIIIIYTASYTSQQDCQQSYP